MSSNLQRYGSVGGVVDLPSDWRMLDDANKMVQLSNELKADVEKTQKDELSIEVLKKAAEVEKLAHDVQQRMKQ